MRPEFTLHDGRKVRITPSRVVGMSEVTLYETEVDESGNTLQTATLLPGGPWVRVVCEGETFDVRGTLDEVDNALDIWETARP